MKYAAAARRTAARLRRVFILRDLTTFPRGLAQSAEEAGDLSTAESLYLCVMKFDPKDPAAGLQKEGFECKVKHFAQPRRNVEG
jgi:hypothetical protein